AAAGSADAVVQRDAAARLHGQADAACRDRNRRKGLERNIVVRLQHHVGGGAVDRRDIDRDVARGRVGELIDVRYRRRRPAAVDRDVLRIEQPRAGPALRRPRIDRTRLGDDEALLAGGLYLAAVAAIPTAAGAQLAADRRRAVRPHDDFAAVALL